MPRVVLNEDSPPWVVPPRVSLVDVTVVARGGAGAAGAFGRGGGGGAGGDTVVRTGVACNPGELLTVSDLGAFLQVAGVGDLAVTAYRGRGGVGRLGGAAGPDPGTTGGVVYGGAAGGLGGLGTFRPSLDFRDGRNAAYAGTIV